MDYRLFRILNGLATRSPLFDALVRFYANNGALIFPALLVALWLVPGREALRTRTAAVAAAAAAVVAFGINQVLNHALNRARPYAVHQVHLLLARSHDASFPSDHTAVAFAVAASLWALRHRLSFGLGVLGILLGISRVIAGVHYPSDVLGGALVGLASAGLVWRLGGRPIAAVTAWGEGVYLRIVGAVSGRSGGNE